MVGFESDEREQAIRKEILLIFMKAFKQNSYNINRKNRKARCEDGRQEVGEIAKTIIESKKEDRDALNAIISELFTSYNTEYGSIKKFNRNNKLIIVARTGGWSDNEGAISKFNSTKFGTFAPIEWWFLKTWKRGGYFRWEIPLFLVEKLDAKKG